MSKIGRKPIDVSGIQIRVDGQRIVYVGQKKSGSYLVPSELEVKLQDSFLYIKPVHVGAEKKNREIKAVWGLQRALLANELNGSRNKFSTDVQINGLGFKAVLAGSDLVMSLGYSHKINFPITEGVTVSLDKTGQKLTFESSDKMKLGSLVSAFRFLRPPGVYKGTGIKKASEVLMRKASKKKS